MSICTRCWQLYCLHSFLYHAILILNWFVYVVCVDLIHVVQASSQQIRKGGSDRGGSHKWSFISSKSIAIHIWHGFSTYVRMIYRTGSHWALRPRSVLLQSWWAASLSRRMYVLGSLFSMHALQTRDAHHSIFHVKTLYQQLLRMIAPAAGKWLEKR